MKRLIPIFIIAAACTFQTPAVAQNEGGTNGEGGKNGARSENVGNVEHAKRVVPDVSVEQVSVMRNNDYMAVEMNVDLRELEVKGNRAVLLTPYLVNAGDSLELYSVGVYSRQRYFYYVRNGESMLSGPTEESYRDKEKPEAVAYHTVVPYEEWMNGSTLRLMRRDYGCCSALVEQNDGPLGGYKNVVYEPRFHYVRPVAAAVKSYALSGRAFIDFPVNRTELYPDYRGNRAELAKIIATIDSVRNDADITVTSITIKGFASPEGKYDNNARLAKGRTETLKNYVQQLYSFAPDFIASDYEPEDWEGLREYVSGSTLEHRGEILAIIDDPSLEPDAKDWRMKQRYPSDYKFLLAEVYPGLRHSDYRITYTVRSYTTAEEIREIMSSTPQKLSLEEMFVLAQSLEPGSDEYNDVFETAVRMFPDNETANLNAANAAMSHNDYVSAGRYLDKAGTSAEAVYARGVLAALRGEYSLAEELVREAASLGMEDTEGVLEHLEEVRRYSPNRE